MHFTERLNFEVGLFSFSVFKLYIWVTIKATSFSLMSKGSERLSCSVGAYLGSVCFTAHGEWPHPPILETNVQSGRWHKEEDTSCHIAATFL